MNDLFKSLVIFLFGCWSFSCWCSACVLTYSVCIKEEEIKQGSGKEDEGGERPPREGILNKGLKSRVHVYSEWMHIPTGANSMSWHHVPMKTKSHANAKSQEYCFWLLKSTESVGSMYVPVASMRLVKSYIWFLFGAGKGTLWWVFLQETADLTPSQPD